MSKRLKNFLPIVTAGLCLAALSLPVPAQDGIKEAPLVSGLKDLRKLSKQLVKISEPSGTATVSLVSRGAGGAGSGVIVSKDGLILTAAHVVDSLGEEVIVIFPDGSRKPAKKLGADFDRDAAMVQITEEGEYPHVKVGQSKDLLRNEWCVALGHPGGFDPTRTPPVRLGRVLNNRTFITTDCAVVGGDSGGPLIDVEGKVIGIHSNIGTQLTENRHVPIAVFLEQWEDMKGGKVSGRRFAQRGPPVDPERAVLGVDLGGPGEEGGVRLQSVMEGSPAEKVGLGRGDVVTKINGEGVNGAQELIGAVGKFKAGEELKVTYVREGAEQEVKVKLARLGDLMGDAPRRERPQRRPGRQREAGPEEAPKEEAPKEEAPKEEAPKEEAPKEEVPKDEAGEEEKKNDPGKQEAEKEANAALRQLLEKALREGDLKLDAEALEELGGMAGLQKLVEEMAREIGPEELRSRLEVQLGGSDRFFASAMKALAPLAKKGARSVVPIQVDGKPAALGTVVSRAGHILTKEFETRKGKVTRMDGEKVIELTLVKRFPKRDLALYQGAPDGLEPVRWADGKERLALGTILTAGDYTGEPMGIGLVSVRQRAMGDIGFLGIQAGEGEGGVRILRTVDGSPAKQVGLRTGDLIIKIDGKEFEGPHDFGNTIRSYRAGDEVEFTYRRGEEEKQIKVKLAARDERQVTPRLRRMNEMSGPLSQRAGGFPEALQHDIPLDPTQCGGPLLDLDGRCVGINVSRAGRVKTLAVPVSDVLKLLAESGIAKNEIAKAKANPGPAPAPGIAKKRKAAEEERAAVLKELRAVEERLKKVERRLMELNPK